MPLAKILYIEDEPDIQELVQYYLEREGYKVTPALSGDQGLALARSEEPDLILLDILLPGLDGLSIIQQLQADGITRAIPVVIVSSKDSESDIILGLGLGAQDYIIKPFRPNVLTARVKAVLRSRSFSHLMPSVADRSLNINPVFSSRKFGKRKNYCFVLMPFGLPWSNRVWREVRRIATDEGFDCKRADDIFGHDILEDIWSSIVEANVIIGDITGSNANVMYEIGIAHTLGKSVILLTQDISAIPFDFKRFRHLVYEDNVEGFEYLRKLLPSFLRERKAGNSS